MATQKQIDANRRNAQSSTGPKTEKGKQISRMNAFRHGIDSQYEITSGEDRTIYDALAAAYDHEFQPLGLVERVLVDLLIRKDWMLRRQAFISADLTNYSLVLMAKNRDGCEFGGGFSENLNANHRHHRHVLETERAYFQHLAELEERQSLRRQHRADVPFPANPSPQTPNPTIGFVSQTPLPNPVPPAAAQRHTPDFGFTSPKSHPQTPSNPLIGANNRSPRPDSYRDVRSQRSE